MVKIDVNLAWLNVNLPKTDARQAERPARIEYKFTEDSGMK